MYGDHINLPPDVAFSLKSFTTSGGNVVIAGPTSAEILETTFFSPNYIILNSTTYLPIPYTSITPKIGFNLQRNMDVSNNIFYSHYLPGFSLPLFHRPKSYVFEPYIEDFCVYNVDLYSTVDMRTHHYCGVWSTSYGLGDVTSFSFSFQN